MYLQNKGFRYIEALVVTLILTIGGCFLMEIIFSRPNVLQVLGGFVPKFEIIQNTKMLYVAIGILGATVMPHNLYLHSSIVQTRKYEQNAEGKAEAVKFATIDSTVALMFALFINAAILIVSAATYHTRGQNDVEEIQHAYKLLSPSLGVPVASPLFAIALLASGRNSTLTARLPGRMGWRGFFNIRCGPGFGGLFRRLSAMFPRVFAPPLSAEAATPN